MSAVKEINQTDLDHNYIYFGSNTLEIGVENLGNLKELILNVELKQKELQEAVQELARYDLKITFSQKQD